jgi:membrane protease YdiL (CAAX protease family)
MKPPLQALGKAFSKAYQRMANLPFLFVLIAIEIYFLVNGKAHFENWDTTYGNLIMVYLIMTIVFIVWSGRKTQEQMRRPLKNSVAAFAMCFIGTYIVLFFLSLTGAIKAGTLDSSLFWQTVLVQVCVVACSEELMFRGVMLEFFGVIVSSILFAVWHTYAYGIIYYNLALTDPSVIIAFIFAFVMGLIFAMVAKQRNFGLSGSIAIHGMYNCFILGVFFALPSLQH